MGGNTQSGNTIPWENWLHGAFSGVSRRQQGLVIFYLFIGLMWWLLYAPRAAGTPRAGVDVTQMLFKDPHGVSVSPLFPDGKGPLGRMGSLTRIWECLTPGCPAGAPPGAAATSSAHPSSAADRCSPACAADGRGNNTPHSNSAAQQGQTPCPETPTLHAPKHQPSVPLSRGATSPQLPLFTPPGHGLGAASRALAAPGQSSSFIILCRPGPAVAVCNREAGRERKFLKSRGLGKN